MTGPVHLPVIQDSPLRKLRLPSKGRRKRTENYVKRNRSQKQMKIDALLYPERNYWRPKTRADCVDGPRPCPYVACRHHLYLDVTQFGAIRFAMDGEPWEMEASCSLDVVDNNPEGLTHEKLGILFGVTHARIQQVLDKIDASSFPSPESALDYAAEYFSAARRSEPSRDQSNFGNERG